MARGKDDTMMWKWMGAVLVMGGCGAVGFTMAWAHRREERLLGSLKGAVDFMTCELHYRMTPLPELCGLVGRNQRNPVGELFRRLAVELERQVMPDVAYCMDRALMGTELPKHLLEGFQMLGNNLGRFDLQGQLKGLEMVRNYCDGQLEAMGKNREERLRSYQTLGLCAGAALAILFV